MTFCAVEMSSSYWAPSRQGLGLAHRLSFPSRGVVPGIEWMERRIQRCSPGSRNILLEWPLPLSLLPAPVFKTALFILKSVFGLFIFL